MRYTIFTSYLELQKQFVFIPPHFKSQDVRFRIWIKSDLKIFEPAAGQIPASKSIKKIASAVGYLLHSTSHRCIDCILLRRRRENVRVYWAYTGGMQGFCQSQARFGEFEGVCKLQIFCSPPARKFWDLSTYTRGNARNLPAAGAKIFGFWGCIQGYSGLFWKGIL